MLHDWNNKMICATRLFTMMLSTPITTVVEITTQVNTAMMILRMAHLTVARRQRHPQHLLVVPGTNGRRGIKPFLGDPRGVAAGAASRRATTATLEAPAIKVAVGAAADVGDVLHESAGGRLVDLRLVVFQDVGEGLKALRGHVC
jgi:hypothetical protein